MNINTLSVNFSYRECILFLFGKDISEVKIMPKKGMKRPQRTHTEERNVVPPVPEIQGKAKNGKVKASPINSTDLSRDNLENDTTAADLQDN